MVGGPGIIGPTGPTGNIGATGPTGPQGPPPDRRKEIEYELCKLDVGGEKSEVTHDLIRAALSALLKNKVLEFKIENGLNSESRDPYLLIVRYKSISFARWQMAIFDVDNLTKDTAIVIEVMDT